MKPRKTIRSSSRVNDSLGHAAGDELIKGAADCFVLSVGQLGKVYRTGGDEFMAIVRTDSPEGFRERIHKKASEWHGAHVDAISVSVGYAAFADHRDATVDDLEHMADADMYVEKDRYYRERVSSEESTVWAAFSLAEWRNVSKAVTFWNVFCAKLQRRMSSQLV